jgi:DNA repair protein RadD
VLDHSGNSARFWAEWTEFFRTGHVELDDGKRKAKPKQAPEREPMKCPKCSTLHAPAPWCPSCGFEYPKKPSNVAHVAGTLKEILVSGDAGLQRQEIWPQVVQYVIESEQASKHRRPEDPSVQAREDRLQRRAQAIYHELTGRFARAKFYDTPFAACSTELRNKIRANQIKWAKRREAQATVNL